MTTVAASWLPAEQAVQLAERVAAGDLIDVRIDLLSGGDMGVSEDHLRVTSRHAKVFEQGSSRVPQGMDTDLPDTGVVADPGERADEITRLNRPPRPGSEDQPGIRPGATEFGPVGGLLLLADTQRVLGEPDERQVALACPGLDRAEVQFALDTLHLLADVQLVAVEVDVLPAQAQHLTPAHPVEQQQDERRVERFRPGYFEEMSTLRPRSTG